MLRRVQSLVAIELERSSQTRTTWSVAGATLAVAGLVAYAAIHPAGAATGGAAPAGQVARAAFGGVGALRVLVVLLGVLSVTSQYHHGDVVWRYLADPSRGLFVAAKAIACAVVGALLGLAVLQLAAALVVVHGPVGLSSFEAAGTVAGTVLGMALAGALGVGIGAAVRTQTAAVVGTLVAVLLVEPLVTAIAPAVGRFLPSAAAGASGGAGSLAWPVGLALYAGYAAAAVAAGTVFCRRADV